MVTVELNKDLADKLYDVLSDHQDEGPYGYGWASDELSQLRVIVQKALMEAS